MLEIRSTMLSGANTMKAERVLTTLYQNTILPRTFFGIDTIQGLLEIANGFTNDKDQLRICEPEDKLDNPNSFYARINDLAKNGYVTVEWKPRTDSSGNRNNVELNKLALTVQGHLLLDDIRKRSKPARLRSRIVELIWVVITSIVTSIITLRIMK